MADSRRFNRNDSGSAESVLIVGATSAIARATARLYAERGARLVLLARNRQRLMELQSDLLVRGAQSVECISLDILDLDQHLPMLEAVWRQLGVLNVALIAHGTLADQEACEKDADLTMRELRTNALSTISLLTHLANLMQPQGHGTLAVITSVAGDRGRRSNYVYGTAKAAVDVFLQGLRNRLHRSGVHVLTIKPGFVDTPMTRNFRKGVLWTSPAVVAKGIMRAIGKRKSITYVPTYWRLIMLIVKAIPETLFKRMSL